MVSQTNSNSAKVMILMAAMTLIGLATTGFQNGLHIEDIAEFISGIILIAIYHFWFTKDINKYMSARVEKEKIFDDRLSLIEKRLEVLKESDTAMIEKKLEVLKELDMKNDRKKNEIHESQ